MSEKRSLWSEAEKKESFEKQKGNIKTDVLIIGGGMAGLLCAYMLKRAGVECVVAEANGICEGVTANTTAKITLQHGLIYDKLIGSVGVNAARLYLNAQRNAIEEFRTLSREISCDFEEQDSYVYSLDSREKLEREADALNRLGCGAELTDRLPLPFETVGAVRVGKQAQFHPLKFAYALARELPVYENTRVTELVPGGALTENGKITAEKIIVATHFPFINKHGSYFLKLYQHRSYVLALDGAESVNGMFVDENEYGLSFRSYGNYLLLGGGSHRTGKKGGAWRELSEFAEKYYPDAKAVYSWATQDCMTLDGIPYIGRYSKNMPDLYVATGFNKWGMTSSIVAASILSDLVRGRENEYAEVFSPSRSILRPQLAINAVESLIGLMTPTAPRCPHLGCALKYNSAEHTWDCPCHGSRFSETGELLNGPATGDKDMKSTR